MSVAEAPKHRSAEPSRSTVHFSFFVCVVETEHAPSVVKCCFRMLDGACTVSTICAWGGRDAINRVCTDLIFCGWCRDVFSLRSTTRHETSVRIAWGVETWHAASVHKIHWLCVD